MIYFITDRKHNVIEVENKLKVLEPSEATTLLNEYMLKTKLIGFDLETNGLDAYLNDILLYIIGDKENQFVFDFAIINLFLPNDEVLFEDKLVLGQNLKFDIKFMKTKHNIEFNKIHDTMIAEQRLSQHELQLFEKKGYYSLEKIIERRLGYKSHTKATRLEFIGADLETFKFTNQQIQYAAADVECLPDIYEKQKELIDRYKIKFLLNDIEFPLVKELGYAELEGFKLDTAKWREIIEHNIKVQYEKETELDNEFKKLRDLLLPAERRFILTGGKYDRIRGKQTVTESVDLFGEPIITKTTSNKKEPYINWSSAAQLIEIFSKLNQPLPDKFGNYVIPKLDKKFKVNKTDITTGEGAIQAYLIENPDSPMKDFINLLIDYREVTTQLNTFGESFISFINPITDKIHTIFRQCDAVTGRLQSGNTKEKYFNCQNVPAQKKFRECFKTDKGYSILTIDLSGAEVVIMADKAKDKVLYDMAIVNDDAHSPIAQACWRAIGKHRKDEKLMNIVITKTENKPLRTQFKAITFGTVYGMFKKKCAKALNINETEGQIVIDTIKKMLPKTFAMVETNAHLATTQGYLTLNTRTNSKIWYPEVYRARNEGDEIDFKDKSKIEGSARNSPIQGTQADMIKESIVVINKYIKDNNIDAKLIITVHDELVYKFKTELTDFPELIKELLLETCDKYLSFITMGADYHVKDSWTK